VCFKLLGSTLVVYDSRFRKLDTCKECIELPREEQERRIEKRLAAHRRRKTKSVHASAQAGAPGLGKRR